jgi:hypothetical protein
MAQQVVWDEAISFGSNAQTGTPQFWVSVAPRVRDQAGSSRGKQYEWDQQQTGQYSPTLINTDAALLPGNTNSPWSPNVGLRRPYRKRFQYPATVNMLTIDQATGGSTQAAGSTVDNVVPVWISYLQFWTVKAEPDAFTGTNVFQQVLSSAPGAGSPVADMDGWTVMPGAAHSAQCVMRATAGGTTPQAQLLLLWRDINGNTIATTTGTTVTLTANSRTWQQLTVSGTAPANAAGATIQIRMANSVAVTWQASGFQLEYAAAPSAWVQPGAWGGVINGWTDRLPQRYTLNGTYATVTPTIVDTFARFSQIFPQPAFYADVLALGPDFFFPLDDPTGSTVFRDLTGKHNPAPVAVSPYGAGTVAAGQSVQSATTSGTFIGAPGPVVTMTNPNTGSGNFEACSYIQLDRSGITGPPASGGWTRQIAFRNTGAGTTAGGLWSASNPSYFGAQNQFNITMGSGAFAGIAVELVSSTAASVYSPASPNYADGNWHLLHATLSADGKTFAIYVDGVGVYTNTTATSQNPTGVTVEDIGAITYPGVNQFYDGYNGDVAHVAQFPTTLTAAQVSKLYTSWRTAWQGDSSGTRYTRILGWANYTGPTSIDTGATSDMGPATDVDGKTDLFTLLQNVVTTENGNHYLNSQGTLTFEARTRRYNQLTPTYVFGANTAAGEYPFTDLGFNFDLDHVANAAEITQQSTGQVFTVTNTASQNSYDTLTLQRTINVVNPQEPVDCANYMVNRFDQPQLRIDSITLNPSRSPALWGVLAALDISTRIRANYRGVGPPTATPLVQFDGFVEQINWTIDAETGDHLAVLQVSPADLNLYWVLAALHTTLASTVTVTTLDSNPTFESGISPWTVTGGTAVQSTAQAHSGFYAAQLTPDGVSSATVFTSEQAAVNPNTTYYVSTWSWVTNGSANWSVSVNWYNSSHTFISSSTVTPRGVAAGLWFQFGTLFTSPSNAAFGQMVVTLGGTPASSNIWYVDDAYWSAQVNQFTVNPLPDSASNPFSASVCSSLSLTLDPGTATAETIGVLSVSATSPGYSSCTVTVSPGLLHSHSAGAVVCEALPTGITDPTTWDAASVIGTTTTPSY